MLLLRRFDDSWMTEPNDWNRLVLGPCWGFRLGKTGGKGGAVFRHAFDQKPATMTVKDMFNQR